MFNDTVDIFGSFASRLTEFVTAQSLAVFCILGLLWAAVSIFIFFSVMPGMSRRAFVLWTILSAGFASQLVSFYGFFPEFGPWIALAIWMATVIVAFWHLCIPSQVRPTRVVSLFSS